MPTIVCEVGYSESLPRLMEGMKLWLLGGRPTVSQVILAKFLHRGARVACKVEVHYANLLGLTPKPCWSWPGGVHVHHRIGYNAVMETFSAKIPSNEWANMRQSGLLT